MHSDTSAGGIFAMSNSLCNRCQGGDAHGWGGFGKAGVHVKLSAVLDPMVPKVLPFVVTCRHDAIVHGFINSVAIIFETTLLLRWNKRQEAFCNGNWLLNCVRNLRSVMQCVEPSGIVVLNLRLAMSASLLALPWM